MKTWISENKVVEVECIVPDLAGAARGKIMPASKFTDGSAVRMPQSIFFQSVDGAYADIVDKINPLDSDMLLKPDPDTIALLPWSKKPCAQIIHDCYDLDGLPISFAPRQLLKRVLKLYADEGWKPVVAPELEFYILQQNLDPKQPLLPPIGRNGRADSNGMGLNIDATHALGPLFDDLNKYCHAQGLSIDTLVHEEGMGQFEVNLLHGDALALADQAFIFKRTVREAALKHNAHASFMAKPLEGQPGSSMHIHQSVVDINTGENLFADVKSGSKTKASPNHLLLAFIAGLQQFQPAAMPLICPYVNSYRRIVKHMSAPINFHWGFDNRSVGFRVPDNDPKSMRVENRLASSDVNPYIAIATSLACGYIGMKRGLKTSAALLTNAYDEPFQMSRDWYQSLQKLSKNEALGEVLGQTFIDIYVDVKEIEMDSFMRAITPWEREHLLLKV